MEIVRTAKEASTWVGQARDKGQSIGLVPTMGALHPGHISLISKALQECDLVVCSVFVNPLQFNDPSDLEKYPRQVEADAAMLKQAGCHLLFAPTKEEVYEGMEPRPYDLGGLDHYLEGPERPGHFQGVINVIERLFHHTAPDKAFFGEKDRQQLAIIRYVAGEQGWPVNIVGCPTVREDDGLAMSSRNALLDNEARQEATVLYKALCLAEEEAFDRNVAHVKQMATDLIEKNALAKVIYFDITDTQTLAPLSRWGDQDRAYVFVAAELGGVRLIDNVELRRQPRNMQ